MLSTRLADFRKQNECNFSLSDVSPLLKDNVFTDCKAYLNDPIYQDQTDAVVCLLILSRDPSYQCRLADEDILSILTREAEINEVSNISSPRTDECKIGALKCLSNVIFKNPLAVDYLRSHGCMEALMNRCEVQIRGEVNLHIMLFDIKILFLCSAIHASARLDLLNMYFKSNVLVDILNWIINTDFSQMIVDLTIELLKFLFNLSYAFKESDESQIKFELTYRSLTHGIRSLLVKSVQSINKEREIISHSVNFLASIPAACYKELLFQHTKMCSSIDFHKDPQVTQALSVLLDFLTYQLDQDDVSSGRSTQFLIPILTVIATASKINRTVRKYFRMKILPHLGAEVKRLPESGFTLRNRLCSRLTAREKFDDATIEAVAFLIFVLCKEKVDRAVKYSGFGNFVGFLSRHGLMAGNRRHNLCQGDYSSTSSESETEDYRELKVQVNPVTGRVEPPRRNPLEGMSDEQKEYEVIKLVNKIDQLQRSGVIQPGVVGGDGRVRPAEHVLELIQDLPEETGNNSSDESL